MFKVSIDKIKSGIKSDYKKITTDIEDIKNKVIEPLTNKCSKLLLEMAKKEDLKSLKKELGILKEKTKEIQKEASGASLPPLIEKLDKMEIFQENLENKIKDFEAKILTKLKHMGETETDLGAVRSLIEQTSMNLRQETGQTVKKLREKVNQNYQDFQENDR